MEIKYKYLPTFYYNSIFDIPYDMFFCQKKIKALFFDLDNTLLKIGEKKLNIKTRKFLQKLSYNFKIVIISNASLKKIRSIITYDYLNYIYLSLFLFRKKPSLWGLKKALQLFDISSDEAIMIGDQLRTDVLVANKMNMISVLVKPLDRKGESFITKLFRILIEKKFINKIKKTNYKEYNRKFKDYLL